MKGYILAILLIIGGIIACSIQDTNQTAIFSDQNVLNLHLMGNGQINVNGDVIPVAGLDDRIKSLDNARDIVVQFKVSEDAKMGTVTDVQKILREKGALKINYTKIN